LAERIQQEEHPMSYDFTMFNLEPNADLYETLSMRERAKGPRLFNKETKQRSRAIVDLLIFKNPRLDWQPSAMGNIESIHIDEGANGNGIQISLFPDEVGITVPYWHEGDAAREVFQQIWDYLGVVQQMTHYVIFDPQLGRLVELEEDYEEVLAAYLGTMNYIDNLYFDENID
jgi:hypothetical protein